MPVMVRFTTGKGTWLAAVEQVLEVRPADAVRPMPDPLAGVIGIIERDGHALPVVQALGTGRRHVLVVQSGETAVGILTDEVSGVSEVAAGSIMPPPGGQQRAFVEATVGEGVDLAFVLDTSELMRELDRDKVPRLTISNFTPRDGGVPDPGSLEMQP
jgi:chemotaxis signal transduction protein